MRNQEIIRKAEMSLATLKSGGLMNPAQASAFIRMVQNTPTIFSESRVIQMENDSQKFEKIGFGFCRNSFQPLFEKLPADLLPARIDDMGDLGDAAVQGGLSTAFGVPVKGVSNIQPYAYGEGDAAAEASDIILTIPESRLTFCDAVFPFNLLAERCEESEFLMTRSKITLKKTAFNRR